MRRAFDFKLLVELAGAGRRGVPAGLRRGDQRAGRGARHGRRVGAGRGRGEAREPDQPGPARPRPGWPPSRPATAPSSTRRRCARLDATRRDVRSVDWERAVPDLIDEALTHIEGRYRAESGDPGTSPPPATSRPSRRAAPAPPSSSTSSATASAATPSCRPGCRRRARCSGPSRTASSSPGRRSAPRSTCSGSCSCRVLGLPVATARRADRGVFRAGAGPAARACPGCRRGSSRRCWRRRSNATTWWARRCPSPTWCRRRSRTAFGREQWRLRRRTARAARGSPCGCPRCSPRPGGSTPSCRGWSCCGCCSVGPELAAASRRGRRAVLIAVPTGRRGRPGHDRTASAATTLVAEPRAGVRGEQA